MKLNTILLFLIGACGVDATAPDTRDMRLALHKVGESCDLDAQCSSAQCVPVFPISPTGVCFDSTYNGCMRVLGSAWARTVCTSLGFTVSLCPKEKTRCVDAPGRLPSQYPYQCCETTLFE